jgi:hypothetical protein
MNRAQAQLQMMHQQRARIVASYLHSGEEVLDTGSARAERLPDRPFPIGDEDFGGFLLVTNQQLVYHDKFGTTCLPWGVIAALQKHRVRGFMTSGMEVQLIDGSNWVFSGNTPFIKSLIRGFNRI